MDIRSSARHALIVYSQLATTDWKYTSAEADQIEEYLEHFTNFNIFHVFYPINNDLFQWL